MLKHGLKSKIVSMCLAGLMLASSVPLASAQSTHQTETLQGGVHATQQGTLYPRVSMGVEGNNPAAKIIGGTVGGAAFGAATGTLAGLTMQATDRRGLGISKGSAAARGLAWGSVYGAGFGLLSGLVSAMTDRDPVAVSSTSNRSW